MPVRAKLSHCESLLAILYHGVTSTSVEFGLASPVRDSGIDSLGDLVEIPPASHIHSRIHFDFPCVHACERLSIAIGNSSDAPPAVTVSQWRGRTTDAHSGRGVHPSVLYRPGAGNGCREFW
jgi:hypothetical protein